MRTIDTFPSEIDLSTVPVDIAQTTGGASIESDQGTLKLFLPTQGGGYCGLREIFFPPTKLISIGAEVTFTQRLVDTINQRFKHVIINRLTSTVRDGSGDRGMVYVRWDGTQNFSLGACHVTECIFEGGGIRPALPIPPSMFSLRAFAGQTLYVVSEFNLDDHMARVYVSSKDGRYRNYMLAEKSLNVVESEYDYWHRIDVFGCYADFGVPADPDAYMRLA